jgi:hypothetical protein
MSDSLPAHLAILSQIEALAADPDNREQSAALEALLLSNPLARKIYAEWTEMKIDLRQVVRAEQAFGIVTLDAPGCSMETGMLWLGNSPALDGHASGRSPIYRAGDVVAATLKIGTKVVGATTRACLRSPLVAGSLVAVTLIGFWLTISWMAFSWVADENDQQQVAEDIGNEPNQIDFVGKLVASVDCSWNSGHSNWIAGEQVPAGPLSLLAGAAQFVLNNNTKLTVTGPAEFELESEKVLHLARGQIAARVTPKGIGFTVETPTAKIVDLGTEFCVAVNNDGDTEVHVLAGAITVTSRDPKLQMDEDLVVRAGQAAKVTRHGFELNLPAESEKFVRDPLQVRVPRAVSGKPLAYPTPLASWNFSESSGAVVADQSGRFMGTIHNPKGVQWLPNGLAFLGHEKTYVDFGDDEALAPEQLSVSVWLKLTSDEHDFARMAIASKRFATAKDTSPAGCWELAVDWQRKLVFRIFSNNDSIFIGKGPDACDADQLQDGRWHHIAGIYDGQRAALYVDGKLIEEIPVPSPMNRLNAPLYLGQYTIDSLQPKNAFRGAIAGPMMIFDKALTSQQIKALLADSPQD